MGKNKTADAVEILKRTTGIDPERDPEMLKISEDLRVAQVIYVPPVPPDVENPWQSEVSNG